MKQLPHETRWKYRYRSNQLMLLSSIIIITLFLTLLVKQASYLNIITIIFYLFYFFIFPNASKYITFTPGNICFVLSTFARYVFLPVMTLIAQNLSFSFGYNIAEKYLGLGWGSIIYEMTFVMFFYVLLRKKYIKKRVINSGNGNIIKPSDMIFSKSVVFLGLALLMLFPYTIKNYSFVFAGESIYSKDIGSSSNVVLVIIDYVRFLIPIIMLSNYVRKKRIRGNKVYLILVLVFIIFSVMFYTKTSRNSVLIPGIAFMFLLVKIFPRKRKMILILMGTFLGIIIFSMTVYKSFNNIGLDLSFLTNYLSTYFMGPKEIAIGYEGLEVYHNSVNHITFFSDMFGNVPIISNYIDPVNRTGQLYNYVYHSYKIVSGGGFIIPSFVQGAFYLGRFLAPLFTLFNVFLFVKLDALYEKQNSILKSFAISRVAIQSALYFSYNVAIMINIVCVWLLPLLFIDWIDNKVRIK